MLERCEALEAKIAGLELELARRESKITDLWNALESKGHE
jgi:hypothetical protein